VIDRWDEEMPVAVAVVQGVGDPKGGDALSGNRREYRATTHTTAGGQISQHAEAVRH
jgi:hypothetical protein